MNKLLHSQKGFGRGVIIISIILGVIVTLVAINSINAIVMTPQESGMPEQATATTCTINIRILASITNMPDVSTNATTQDLIRRGLIPSNHECPSGGVYTNNNGEWSCNMH